MKIGFLFNHEEAHQIAHTAPIISHLQKQRPAAQVHVLYSGADFEGIIAAHLDPQIKPPEFRRLQRNRAMDLAEKLIGSMAPVGRIGGLSANLELLQQYDALVVPETMTTMLKSRYGVTDTRLIFFPHGAGDRSISISEEMALFDYVLLPGAKTRDRMLEAKVIRQDNHALVGYPKFDVPPAELREPLFPNDRPIVLYNPHFDPRLSSWYEFALPLLEYFAAQDRFNLIVAPHVMLFRRKILASLEHRQIRMRRNIPARFFEADNIHIDLGSPACVDMTYTRAADIYLGDVSSQVYEFIERPRPAIFLNGHAANWRGDPNYAFWEFGSVAEDMAEFESALDRALPLDDNFAAAQQNAFAQTFAIDPRESSASRAARAIADYLDRELASISAGAPA